MPASRALASRTTGLALLAELEAAGAITPTGLHLTNPDIPFAKWASLGHLFGHVKDVSSWLIGDWILWGEAVYGEKYSDAVESTGLAEATLANYVYVCRSVAFSRRREVLRFGHHAQVAALEPAEQVEWLDRAEAEGWTRTQLREAMREAKGLPPAPEQPDWTPSEAKTVARLKARVAELEAERERTAAEPSPESPSSARIAAAGHLVSLKARQTDEGDWRVPAKPMALLRAALGEAGP